MVGTTKRAHTASVSLCVHLLDCNSDSIALLGQRPDLHSAPCEVKWTETSFAHESWESCLSKGLSRVLRGEKVEGYSSLINCSCSPSLTGSMAKDDPCAPTAHVTYPHRNMQALTHTYNTACLVLLLSKLVDRLLGSRMLGNLSSE